MKSNNFSGQRYELLWGYYAPRMIKYILIVAVVEFLIYLLAVLGSASNSFGLLSITFTLIFIPFYLCPLTFAMGRDTVAEIQLPASNLEKALVILPFCTVVVPLAMLLWWLSLQGIFSTFSDYADVISFFRSQYMSLTEGSGLNMVYESRGYLNSVIREYFPMLLCLFVVLNARRQRVLKGVMAVVCAFFGLMLIGMVYGVYLAYQTVIHAPSGNEGAYMKDAILQSVPTAILVSTLIFSALFILFVVLIYRKIKNRQV